MGTSSTGAFKAAAVALVVVACLMVGGPLLISAAPSAPLTNGDWQQVYFHQASARDSYLGGGGLPFWSPYVNGGFPLTAHPYDPSFSPLLLSTLVFGEFYAPRINTALAYFAGAAGMALLAGRVLGFSPWGVFAATLVYVCSGWLPARLFGGNYWEVFHFLFPLAAYCLAQSRAGMRSFLLLAVLLYLFICEAGFVFPAAVFFLGVLCLAGEGFFSPDSRAKRMSLLLFLLMAVIFSCGLGAIKISQLWTLITVDPRPVDYLVKRPENPMSYFQLIAPEGLAAFWKEFFRVKMIPAAMTVPASEGLPLLRPQYIGCGFMPVVLGVAAFIRAPRRFYGAFAFFVIATLFTIGQYMTIDFFRPFTHLPVFSAISCTFKVFNYYMFFGVCILCGGFFHLASGPDHPKIRRILLTVLLIAAVAPPLSQHRKIFSNTFVHDPPVVQKKTGFFQVDRYPLYIGYKSGLGIVEWFSSLHMPANAQPRFMVDESTLEIQDNSEYKGEAWLAKGEGKILKAVFDYNRIEIVAETEAAATIALNQNYSTGWKSSHGRVKKMEGLLAVDLPTKGRHEIQLSYFPAKGAVFFAVSLVFFALTIYLFINPKFFKERKRPWGL